MQFRDVWSWTNNWGKQVLTFCTVALWEKVITISAATAVKEECEGTLGLRLVAYPLFAFYSNSDLFTVEQLFVLFTSVHITVLRQSSATPPCQLLWLTNCMTWTTLTLIFLVEDMSSIYHGRHFQGMSTDKIFVSILCALRTCDPHFSFLQVKDLIDKLVMFSAQLYASLTCRL